MAVVVAAGLPTTTPRTGPSATGDGAAKAAVARARTEMMASILSKLSGSEILITEDRSCKEIVVDGEVKQDPWGRRSLYICISELSGGPQRTTDDCHPRQS